MPREFYLVCLCALVALHLGSADAAKGLEQRLWESLGRTKDQNSYFPNKSNVTLQVQLIALSDLDPESGSLAVSYYLTQTWMDQSASWDKKKFNVPHISVPSDKLWLPDIVPYRVELHEKVIDNRVLIYNNGKVMNVPYHRTRVTCEKVPGKASRRFCRIKFGSWTLDGNRLNVTLGGKLDLSDTSFVGLEDSGWEFVKGNLTRNVAFYSCCPEPYPSVTLTVTIRRKATQEPEEEEEETEERRIRMKRKPRKNSQNRRRMEEEDEEEDRSAFRKRQPMRRSQNRRRMEEEDEEEDRSAFRKRQPMRRWRRRRRNPRRRCEEDDWEEEERM